MFAVYRLFDCDGALLYVGCSDHPDVRLKTHKRKPWGTSISRMTKRWYQKREIALMNERNVIVTEKPKFNKVYSKATVISKPMERFVGLDMRIRNMKPGESFLVPSERYRQEALRFSKILRAVGFKITIVTRRKGDKFKVAAI